MCSTSDWIVYVNLLVIGTWKDSYNLVNYVTSWIAYETSVDSLFKAPAICPPWVTYGPRWRCLTPSRAERSVWEPRYPFWRTRFWEAKGRLKHSGLHWVVGISAVIIVPRSKEQKNILLLPRFCWKGRSDFAFFVALTWLIDTQWVLLPSNGTSQDHRLWHTGRRNRTVFPASLCLMMVAQFTVCSPILDRDYIQSSKSGCTINRLYFIAGQTASEIDWQHIDNRRIVVFAQMRYGTKR